MDVTAESFERDVLERSHELPVVVDFWAAWCAPCRQLSPLLERAAERHAGEVELVKVDVDAAPTLARSYRVQGIPSVKAFRDGVVVAEFTGAQPAAVVDRFFAALAPTAADRLVAQADASFDESERERLLRAALEDDAGHRAALLSLARLLAKRGEVDQAQVLLARMPADAEARALAAELRLRGAARDEADLAELRRLVEAGDPRARLALGRALAGRGEHAAALEALLPAVAVPGTREQARAAVLEIFSVLGEGHDLVKRTRPRLASALF
jgi:putative thioredoxin